MDKEERKMIAVGAHLEGLSVATKHIGKMVEVSEMELTILCNMARLGLVSVLSEALEPEDQVRFAAEAEKEELIRAIHETFTDEKVDGMNRISQGAVALLGSERFEKYILEAE